MNLGIQRRLTLGSLFLYILMMASVGLGLYYLVSIDSESKAVLADNYDSVRFVQGIHHELDLADTDRASAQLRLDSLIGAQENNITEPGEREVTASLRAHFESWKVRPDSAEAKARWMRGDLDRLIDLNLDAIERKSGQAQKNAGHALFWLFLLAVLLALVGLGFSVAFPTVMSAPIVRLKEAVKEMAAHNYHHRIPPFKIKELNELGEAFNDMARALERYDHSNMARLMAEKSRAEAVINSLQDASIGVNDQGVVLFANQQALDLLGLTALQVVGAAAAEVATRNDLFRHIMGSRASAPIKVVSEGVERYYICESVPITGAGGVLGTLFVLKNITPFQERDQAKTRFLATISHELKTPLASTDIGLGLLERQTQGNLTQEQQAMVADLRKDHQRLVRIVSELLDLSQAETGNIRVTPIMVPLYQVVTDALAAVKLGAEQKNIVFQVSADLRTLNVHADPDKAVWVLVNVLTNAIRHSPSGGTIHLATRQVEGRVLLTVRDQGPGIPVEEREHLFQRFTPSAVAHRGTGLGLSIAREFMRAMDGQIAFDDLPGEGAAFVVTFAKA